jgi:hypothetical protein
VQTNAAQEKESASVARCGTWRGRRPWKEWEIRSPQETLISAERKQQQQKKKKKEEEEEAKTLGKLP